MPTVPFKVPILGHFGELMLKRKAFAYVVKDLYNDIEKMGLKFAGIYQFTRRQIIVTDPDIIREVTVRHFEHFADRRPFTEKGVDELLGRSLLSLQGEEWKNMRHTLSPAFTGKKLRSMLPLIETACQQLTKFLRSRPDPNEPLDVHETARRLAADVIATTAFGNASDSLNKANSDFYDHGIKLMDVSGTRAFVFFGYLMSPAFMKMLKIPFVPKVLTDFFTSTIFGSINYRESKKVSRPDMIQLMLDARSEDKDKISDMDIASQAFTFFLGGFDTIAGALCFIVQLLAMHPDVQDRLREETEEAFEKGNGSLSYEALNELTYMDMVISEVLRMFPPAPMLDRMCVKAFELPEYGLNVEKGVSVGVSVFGLHYDPQYFPDPERFDPERFSEENKNNIKPFTYLPFGAGPRNCIGLRFAQLELKLVIAHILSAVDLSVSERTQVPIRLTKDTTQMKPEGGFWVKATPRVTA